MRTVTLLLVLLSAPALHAQTTYTWSGGTGSWDDSSNWTPNGVPAAADTAVVGEANQGTRIATLTETTTVAGLEIAGLGVVAGDFDLTITDRFAWSGGGAGFEAIRGTGTVTVGPDATLRMVEPAGRFHIGDDRILVNEGLAVWETPTLWEGGGRFVNNGELILAFGETDVFGFVFSSLADAFTNSATGLIRRTGTGNARYSAGLVNDGLIRVENGGFDLKGFNATGTTGSGSVEVEDGAVLLVTGGNHTQASVTGEAVTSIGGGRLIVTDAYEVTTTRLESGAGGLVLDADGTTETLEMESGFLDGSGTLTVTDAFTWSGGVMQGSGTTVVPSTATLSISGEATKALRGTRTLRNESTGTWSGSGGFSNYNGTLFLNAGALEVSAGTPDPFGSFFAGTFTNTGTFTLTSGTVTRFSSFFHNEGTVDVASGALLLSGFNANGGTDTGRYVVADSARLEFTGGDRTLAEDAEVVGTGTAVFGGSNVTNRATWQPGLSPGVLTVDSDYDFGSSVLEIELGGTVPGDEHDQLAVTGTAALGGTLRVTLTDGFTPAEGDRFLIVPAAAVTGDFDTLDLPVGVEAFVETTDTTAVLVIGMVTASEDGAAETLPTAFALHAAYPNPFNPQAMVPFDVPEAGRVRLTLYDALGREVAALVDGERPAGRHEAVLDGAGLPSGVYLVRLSAGAVVQTRRVTLVR